jgi:hypothetical protein
VHGCCFPLHAIDDRRSDNFGVAAADDDDAEGCCCDAEHLFVSDAADGPRAACRLVNDPVDEALKAAPATDGQSATANACATGYGWCCAIRSTSSCACPASSASVYEAAPDSR